MENRNIFHLSPNSFVILFFFFVFDPCNFINPKNKKRTVDALNIIKDKSQLLEDNYPRINN